MAGVVSPVLHNNDPVNPLAEITDLPHWSATDIPGADGIDLGAATPLPAWLVQASSVCITVYVAPVVTEMDAVVSPVLHKSDPVNPDAVNTELPQLLTTDTSGVGAAVSGDAIPWAEGLVHPFNICATEYVP